MCQLTFSGLLNCNTKDKCEMSLKKLVCKTELLLKGANFDVFISWVKILLKSKLGAFLIQQMVLELQEKDMK